MKKILFLVFIAIYFTGYPQETFYGTVAARVIPEALSIHFNKTTLRPDFIRLNENSEISEKSFEEWIAKSLKMSKEEKFIPFRSEKDNIGLTHVRYQLYYRNIPVEAGIFIGHYSPDRWLKSANGFYRDGILYNKPDNFISEKDALDAALSYVNAEEYKWDSEPAEKILKVISGNLNATYYPKGELIYFPEKGNFFSDQFILTYKFDVYALHPLKRINIYVDAVTGKVLYEMNRLHTIDTVATAITKYSGTQAIITDSYSGSYRLRESARGGGIETYQYDDSLGLVDFTDPDNYWDNFNAQWDEVATDAHWGAEMSYDFFYNSFGRNSYNNIGGKINSMVHAGYPWPNAVWEGGYISYGDGDSTSWPLISVDIVGHEFTHGVTEYSAGLYYIKESGALNESFSDMFGTAIEYYAKPQAANFLIGEQVVFLGNAFRSLANPNLYNCPDTYHGNLWDDNGDVHYNSGVPNFWFYLLCEGGADTNDLGNIYNVAPLGIDTAIQIAYRTLTVYLTPLSDFFDARIFSSQSAADLYGDCSDAVIATENAWYAVGVGEMYNTAATTADFTVDNPSPCNLQDTIHFTNLSSMANVFLWNFGDGTTSTAKSPGHIYSGTGTFSVQLIASADGVCGNGSDSIIKTSFISVTNSGPSPPQCNPTLPLFPPVDFDIYNFTFGSINNSTVNDGFYNDYSCQFQTTVVAGNSYPVSIETNPYFSFNTNVWIDWNNNRLFEPAESAFSTYTALQFHTGSIVVPNNSIKNVPLRIRVGADYSDSLSPCSEDIYKDGQYEDYTVTVVPVTGMEKISDKEALSVYPNPFGNYTYFYNLEKDENSSIRVFDMYGNLVSELLNSEQIPGEDRILFDGRNLGTGIYNVEIKTQNRVENKKLFLVK